MPKICEKGGSGIFFPQEDGYNKLNDEPVVATIVYLLLLFWCFLGVAIVADIFMSAIEAITSKRKDRVCKTGRVFSVRVWNKTVANLTLMALGSSAPEILLSCIELLGNEMYAADLGPSTIVGSAAFNQLVIIAICVAAIPKGQTRRIEEFSVFVVTGSFSVFAYVWLVIIVAGISPNVIEIWEGVLTFVFFPVLVILAFVADKGLLKIPSSQEESLKLDKIREDLLRRGVSSDKEEADMLAKQAKQDMLLSRAKVRMSVSANTCFLNKKTAVTGASVGFMSTNFSCAVGQAEMTLDVEKIGQSLYEATVTLKCVVYTANEETQNVTVMIPAGQTREALRVDVPRHPVDTETCFWVDIVSASAGTNKRNNSHVSGNLIFSGAKIQISEAARRAKISVSKCPESGRGQIRFRDLAVKHAPLESHKSKAILVLDRVGGTEGDITVGYTTNAGTAKNIYDFFQKTGTCEFRSGALENVIEIEIASKPTYEKEDKFTVVISNVDEENPSVMKNFDLCSVTILESSSGVEPSSIMRALDATLNIDAMLEGNAAWKQQFGNALRPIAVEDDEEAREAATALDWMIHILAFPWKLAFALIPPPQYCGGWLCFCVALMFIGVVTAVIGDLASLTGCTMGLKDKITAITIVALGTSLPDAFASKVAATEDPVADNAIGNVTGSNSVNVFLGLGLPWMIASIFWVSEGPTNDWKTRYASLKADDKIGDGFWKDGGFVVDSEGLTFSVLVFLVCTISALLSLVYRRHSLKAELGGPEGTKYLTSIFFVLLWFLYAGLASWSIEVPDVSAPVQIGATVGAYCGVLLVMLIVAMLMPHISRCFSPSEPDIRAAPTINVASSNPDQPVSQNEVAQMRGSIMALEKQIDNLSTMLEQQHGNGDGTKRSSQHVQLWAARSSDKE